MHNHFHLITILSRSAVDTGYLKDDFIHLLVRHSNRQLPLMNRGKQWILLFLLASTRHLGTFVRTTIIDQLMKEFITAHKGSCVQVVSFGSGWDTRYFNFKVNTSSITILTVILPFRFLNHIEKRICALFACKILWNRLSSCFGTQAS